MRLHLDFRRNDVWELCDRQSKNADAADNCHKNRDNDRDDRAIDEEPRHLNHSCFGPVGPTIVGVPAGAVHGFAVTGASSLTFWTPCTTSFSPAWRPSLISHIGPKRSPTFTCRMLALLS